MFHVVLVQPEIPPNTGNVIRLCANTGCMLHLIKPLGFPIDHARMRRAGLDYHEFTTMRVHESWPDFLASLTSADNPSTPDPTAPEASVRAGSSPTETLVQTPASPRLFAFSTQGRKSPYQTRFWPGDYLIFGRETAGLPDDVLASLRPEQLLRLPMRPNNRSLNLSNAVAVSVFEAWRQQGFEGAADN